MAIIASVDSDVSWIETVSRVPLIGGVFAFLLIFIVPVLLSIIIHQFIEGLSDEIGFTKAMLVLLPIWNLYLWLKKVRTKLFFMPAWVFLVVISVLKAMSLFS